jgi:hypothetical protein
VIARRSLVLAACLLPGCALRRPLAAPSPDPRYRIGELIDGDAFRDGLTGWALELETGGTVTAHDGVLEMDVPRGGTAWRRREFVGPVMIQYDAMAVSAGGANDRVSDLNAFWMATDPRSPGHILEQPRSGRFEDYEPLRMYYLGYGGNSNTTTRFRRYAGQAGRPLLPENDRRGPTDLIQPNRWHAFRLVAAGGLVQVWRDGEKLFEMADPEPYTRGGFGLRTTQNHMRVRDLRVHRLHLTPRP